MGVETVPSATIGTRGHDTVTRCLCNRDRIAGRRLRHRLNLDLPAVARGLRTLRSSKLVHGNRLRSSANKHGTRGCRFGPSRHATVKMIVQSGRLHLYTVGLCNGIVRGHGSTLPCHGAGICCRHVNNVVGGFTTSIRGGRNGILNISFTVRNVLSPSTAAVVFNAVVNGAKLALRAVDRSIRCPYVVVRSSSTSTVTRL